MCHKAIIDEKAWRRGIPPAFGFECAGLVIRSLCDARVMSTQLGDWVGLKSSEELGPWQEWPDSLED